VGGNELRMADGARRMTPGERIDAMVSPMETGVLRDQKDAKGLSQKQTLQDTGDSYVHTHTHTRTHTHSLTLSLSHTHTQSRQAKTGGQATA